MKKINKTMMQYFEWYLPSDFGLWKKILEESKNISDIGITSVWLPPAYKASDGINGVGYAVYDLYDLGEFDQKGAIRTKYGTKEEYLNAIKSLQENGVKVFADIVLNHRLGADGTEEVYAIEDLPSDRNVDISKPFPIQAWTKYEFPGRRGKYSDFKWNWTHFHGVDWDEFQKRSSIYKFYGKHWDKDVDKENGNFDYLMGADIDLNNVDVTEELKRWGLWYAQFTNIDGFRMDAVKHMRASFMESWLNYVRNNTNRTLPAVGEYWSTSLENLKNYIKETNASLSLFDVPLHYNLFNASNSGGNYDMKTIFDNTLVNSDPDLAVTFVDNHDTQLGQSLQSWVQDWFKPIAYALILLRKDGYPCVFFGDYYGIPHDNIQSKKDILDTFIKIRRDKVYGKQNDYFNDFNIIGWTIEGDEEHENSGMAVILSDGPGGSKCMNVGKGLANSVLKDCTGNIKETVYVDNDGNGIFYCNGGSVSVWVKE